MFYGTLYHLLSLVFLVRIFLRISGVCQRHKALSGNAIIFFNICNIVSYCLVGGNCGNYRSAAHLLISLNYPLKLGYNIESLNPLNIHIWLHFRP